MIRKPTIFMLFVVLGFVGVYFYARHDLVRECPQFFKQPLKQYSTPVGLEDYDDGQSWTGCTDQDVNYLGMEEWVFWMKISGLLCGLLFMADVAAFSLARSHRREDFEIKRGQLVVQRRRLLHKISRFLGGL